MTARAGGRAVVRRRDARLGAGREALGERAHLAVAHAALARAHRDRRVALEQLGRARSPRSRRCARPAPRRPRRGRRSRRRRSAAPSRRARAARRPRRARPARRPRARARPTPSTGAGGEQVAGRVHRHGRCPGAAGSPAACRLPERQQQVALDLLGAARVAHAHGLDALPAVRLDDLAARWRARRRGSRARSPRRRAATTAAISVPTACSAAMCSGTSCVPAEHDGDVAGLDRRAASASRAAPRPSITPGTSLPGKTSIDSNAPVATTIAFGCGHDAAGRGRSAAPPGPRRARTRGARAATRCARGLDLRRAARHGVARRARAEPAARRARPRRRRSPRRPPRPRRAPRPGRPGRRPATTTSGCR